MEWPVEAMAHSADAGLSLLPVKVIISYILPFLSGLDIYISKIEYLSQSIRILKLSYNISLFTFCNLSSTQADNHRHAAGLISLSWDILDYAHILLLSFLSCHCETLQDSIQCFWRQPYLSHMSQTYSKHHNKIHPTISTLKPGTGGFIQSLPSHWSKRDSAIHFKS